MMNLRELRLFSWSNATCAMPLCEALSSRRGRGPPQGARRNLGYLVSGRQALSEGDGPHREGEEP